MVDFYVNEVIFLENDAFEFVDPKVTGQMKHVNLCFCMKLRLW